ncbi:MAG: superinfection immunity protein [Clostridia bacterium]|nr:superinfection immunity protein [Clostridia bacterium]
MLNNLLYLASATTTTQSTGSSFFPLIILWCILGVAFYFIPTIVAYKRKHLNKVSILLVNIFLGWTFIGWVVALVWSASNSR